MFVLKDINVIFKGEEVDNVENSLGTEKIIFDGSGEVDEYGNPKDIINSFQMLDGED